MLEVIFSGSMEEEGREAEGEAEEESEEEKEQHGGGHTSVFIEACQSQSLSANTSSIDWHKSLTKVAPASH